MAKSEVIRMINERLYVPEAHLDDVTLAVVLNLLIGEMWNCDEETLRIHESGVARFITQRGGMHGVENRVLAEVAAA